MSTAMIWGANGGIGRAVVAKLTTDGWTVLAVARNPGDLHALTPHVFEADVADADAVEMAVSAARQISPTVDLWVYAAGDITAAKVAEMEPSDWQRILDANLTGAFVTAHSSLPLLAKDEHMMFLGAVSERMRLPGLTAYAAAKAGLEAFAAALGKEERKRRVTVLRPAAVNTTLWEKVPFRRPAHALEPEDVAKRIVSAYQEGHKGVLDF